MSEHCEVFVGSKQHEYCSTMKDSTARSKDSIFTKRNSHLQSRLTKERRYQLSLLLSFMSSKPQIRRTQTSISTVISIYSLQLEIQSLQQTKHSSHGIWQLVHMQFDPLLNNTLPNHSHRLVTPCSPTIIFRQSIW